MHKYNVMVQDEKHVLLTIDADDILDARIKGISQYMSGNYARDKILSDTVSASVCCVDDLLPEAANNQHNWNKDIVDN